MAIDKKKLEKVYTLSMKLLLLIFLISFGYLLFFDLSEYTDLAFYIAMVSELGVIICGILIIKLIR